MIEKIKIDRESIKRFYSSYGVEICNYGDKVDPHWGLDAIKITDEHIKALQNGQFLYFDDGEYAHLITKVDK